MNALELDKPSLIRYLRDIRYTKYPTAEEADQAMRELDELMHRFESDGEIAAYISANAEVLVRLHRSKQTA